MTRAGRGLEQMRLAARRAGDARRRPLLAVLESTGADNFGDEWMAAALRSRLPSWTLTTLRPPHVERRLARIGLSGKRTFDGLLVSGGTLFNAYFHACAGDTLAVGLPAWSVGTGAGSPGPGIDERDAHPEIWADALRRFERVTVRGPLSVSRLRAAGVEGVEAVGDLALLNTPDAPVQPRRAGAPRLLVNLVGDAPAARDGALLDAAADGLRALQRRGWTAVPVAAHAVDLAPLRALGERIGGWGEPYRVVSPDMWESGQLGEVRAIVAARLHVGSLGWIHGRDVVALGHRDKTMDFAAQIGADDDVTDLSASTAGAVSRAIAALVDRDPARTRAIHARAVACRDRQRELLREIDARARD